MPLVVPPGLAAPVGLELGVGAAPVGLPKGLPPELPLLEEMDDEVCYSVY